MKSKSNYEKEHVTTGMRNNPKYKLFSMKLKNDFSKLRLTIDTLEDYRIVQKLFKFFKFDFKVSLKQILRLYKNNPKFFETESIVRRFFIKYFWRSLNIILNDQVIYFVINI